MTVGKMSRFCLEIIAKRTKDMWICFSELIDEPPSIHIGDEIIERVNVFKLLGVWLQNNLKWNQHIEEITRRGNKKLYHLRDCRKSYLPTLVGLTVFKSVIRPTLEYAPVWGGIPKYLQNKDERAQTRCLKIIGLENASLDFDFPKNLAIWCKHRLPILHALSY